MAKAKEQQTSQTPNSDEPGSVSESNTETPTWSCLIKNSPKDGQWTVGELIDMSCEGPTVAFQSTDLQFKLPEKAQYQLKIVTVDKQTDNQIELKATSYNAGQHPLKELFLTDQGQERVQIESFTLPVKSVLESKEQKPFGPVMAVKMTYPPWVWMSVLITLLIVLLFAFFRLRRRSQMKKVLEALKEHNTALGPYNQFNKDIRLLSRDYMFDKKGGWTKEQKEKYLESLDQIFRMYVLREFFVPALTWNDRLLLKTISKQDKKYFQKYGSELKKLLAELNRAQKDQEKVQVHDCKQLTQMAQRVTQTVWKVRKVQK